MFFRNNEKKLIDINNTNYECSILWNLKDNHSVDKINLISKANNLEYAMKQCGNNSNCFGILNSNLSNEYYLFSNNNSNSFIYDPFYKIYTKKN